MKKITLAGKSLRRQEESATQRAKMHGKKIHNWRYAVNYPRLYRWGSYASKNDKKSPRVSGIPFFYLLEFWILSLTFPLATNLKAFLGGISINSRFCGLIPRLAWK